MSKNTQYKMLKEMMGTDFSFGGSSEEPNPAANIFSQQTQDHPDTVTFDVPTLIRVMEWANEDAEDDVMLHQFANALIVASFNHNPLTMDDYEAVCDAVCPHENVDPMNPPASPVPAPQISRGPSSEIMFNN